MSYNFTYKQRFTHLRRQSGKTAEFLNQLDLALRKGESVTIVGCTLQRAVYYKKCLEVFALTCVICYLKL